MTKKIRCIIAEDYKQLNELYFNLLNYEDDIEVVGTAFNSNEVLELVKANKVDVILMDIEMESSYDGIESCRKVLEADQDIKVIMLTCHYEQDVILSAYKAGAVDYVLKTESSAVILDSVRSAYMNNSPIRPFVARIIRNEIKDKGTSKKDLSQIIHIITQLTGSEIEVLLLLSKGMRQVDIAKARYIEVSTVKSHVNSFLKKFKMKRASDVVDMLRETGLIDMLQQ